MNGELKVPPTEELAQKGQKIYERLKPTLEPAKNGWYVAIEVVSEQYFLGETAEKAIEEAKKAFPDKLFYVTRIGGPARISIRFPHGYDRIFR
jgi:predicted RNase H-like HicB family nuclease